MATDRHAETAQLKFRDPQRAAQLRAAIERTVAEVGHAPVTIMHVCGSHEQAIAKFGLRSILPPAIDLIMGPGCPVCITDMPEVDEAVALSARGVRVATYGDMIRVPGTTKSLADAQADGAHVHVVYSVAQAVEMARTTTDEVVFFATGFETTAVATAAVLLAGTPPNFSVLSAHKYVPPAMEIVASLPDTRIEGFLAAGHAATITGWRLFEPMARKYHTPIVVAGFEPLDILAAILRLVELVRDRRAEVVNMYPRCVSPDGNRNALDQMWRVFELTGGHWRGIAWVPDGNLQLRAEWAHVDARTRFGLGVRTRDDQPAVVTDCICGEIMIGRAAPTDCTLFGTTCLPESPVGACMVSSEGTCRIWYQYGGQPNLAGTAR